MKTEKEQAEYCGWLQYIQNITTCNHIKPRYFLVFFFSYRVFETSGGYHA